MRNLFLLFFLLFFIACQKEIVSDVSLPSQPEEALETPIEPISLPPEEEVAAEPAPVAEVIEEKIVGPVEIVKENIVTITDKGFQPDRITIKVGEAITWVNARNETGKLRRVLIVGAQGCVDIPKTWLEPGESFRWTFEREVLCPVIDGYTLSQVSFVTVK